MYSNIQENEIEGISQKTLKEEIDLLTIPIGFDPSTPVTTTSTTKIESLRNIGLNVVEIPTDPQLEPLIQTLEKYLIDDLTSDPKKDIHTQLLMQAFASESPHRKSLLRNMHAPAAARMKNLTQFKHLNPRLIDSQMLLASSDVAVQLYESENLTILSDSKISEEESEKIRELVQRSKGPLVIESSIDLLEVDSVRLDQYKHNPNSHPLVIPISRTTFTSLLYIKFKPEIFDNIPIENVPGSLGIQFANERVLEYIDDTFQPFAIFTLAYESFNTDPRGGAQLKLRQLLNQNDLIYVLQASTGYEGPVRTYLESQFQVPPNSQKQSYNPRPPQHNPSPDS